jgi:hypothetical protein
MTVYVIQDVQRMDRETGLLSSKLDFGPAREFGELSFLLSPTAGPFNPDSIIDELHGKLCDFTGADCLLLVGNPVLIGLAVSIAASYNEGCVNLLQWSGSQRRYIMIHVADLFRDIGPL